MNEKPVDCPRCAFETVTRLATSPVPGVWDVLQCGRCLYTWRTIEPARRTRRDAYPDAFKLTEADIDDAIEVPAVPPLRSHSWGRGRPGTGPGGW